MKKLKLLLVIILILSSLNGTFVSAAESPLDKAIINLTKFDDYYVDSTTKKAIEKSTSVAFTALIATYSGANVPADKVKELIVAINSTASLNSKLRKKIYIYKATDISYGTKKEQIEPTTTINSDANYSIYPTFSGRGKKLKIKTFEIHEIPNGQYKYPNDIIDMNNDYYYILKTPTDFQEAKTNLYIAISLARAAFYTNAKIYWLDGEITYGIDNCSKKINEYNSTDYDTFNFKISSEENVIILEQFK